MAHFYVVAQYVSPVLAWGFLGSDEKLKEVCEYFKVQYINVKTCTAADYVVLTLFTAADYVVFVSRVDGKETYLSYLLVSCYLCDGKGD